MPYPSVFKPIKKGNYRVTPFQVFKQYSFDNNTLSASFGHKVQFATHRKEKTPIGTTELTTYGQNFAPAGTTLTIRSRADNDPRNLDGSYQNVIWRSLNHLYYRDAYDPANNFGASNPNRIEKFLFYSASSFTIPYFKVGESVKPGTVIVTDNSNDFQLYDDRKGNLRDSRINSQSFASASHLVGYWGFNDEFRKFKNNYGTHDHAVEFQSNVFQTDVKSSSYRVRYNKGIMTSGLFDIAARGYTGSELVPNPTFTGTHLVSANGWVTSSTAASGSFKIVGGKLHISSSLIVTGSGGGTIFSALSVNGTIHRPGRFYKVQINGLNIQSGTVELKYARAHNSTPARPLLTSADNGTYVDYYEAADTGDTFTINSSGTILASMDSVSVKEIFPPRAGMQAYFDGRGYIKTPAYTKLNFDQDDDFAISFWYGGGISQSISGSTTNALISKRGTQDTLILNRKTRKRELKEQNITRTRYPFDIEIFNQTAGKTNVGKIRFRRSDGVDTFSSASAVQCTGSTHPTKGPEYHILAQKSGSELELWVNGVKQWKAKDTVPNEVRNQSKLMFGALNTDLDNALSGSLDEIRIYDYALHESAIASLANNHFKSGSAFQTSVAGNIFYKGSHGVISSAMPKYHKALGVGGNEATSSWQVQYKGTHTIYENEVLVEVPAGHFNVTMNPTALQRINTDRLKKDFTASLSPYVTTIGLYNQDAQLLAIGKLAQPITKRSDVDMNFIVRWDY